MSNQTLLLIARPPFLTVRVGKLKTVETMRQALAAANCRIDDLASDMMNQLAFVAGIVQKKRNVEFVIASIKELGEATDQDFSQGCTSAQAYKAARKLGWKTCEPSDAIDIRLATLDQPEGWFLVSMDPPIAGSYGGLRVFRVGRGEDELWLSSDYGRPDYYFSGYYRVVFRRK